MFKSHMSRACLSAFAMLPATLLSTAQPAQAQLTLDGTLRLELAHNEDTSVNTKRFRGSFDGLVWNDMGLQLDIGVGKHEHHESTQPSATLHGYYRVDDTLSYGVFLAAEDRRPGNSYFYGAEVTYQGDAFGIEAFAAYRDDIAESTDGGRYGLDVTYALPAAPRWTLLAGGVGDDGAPVEQGSRLPRRPLRGPRRDRHRHDRRQHRRRSGHRHRTGHLHLRPWRHLPRPRHDGALPGLLTRDRAATTKGPQHPRGPSLISGQSPLRDRRAR